MAEMIAGEASSSRGGAGDAAASSVVIDHGRRKTSCGYCKSSDSTSLSHGLWARSITADDYQALLDRGWRRSGSFLYKPEMERSCCKSYTIRLKANDFVPSKEQLRVYRRMQRFLDGTLNENRSCRTQEETDSSKSLASLVEKMPAKLKSAKPTIKLNPSEKSEDMSKADNDVHLISDSICSAVSKCIDLGEFPPIALVPKAVVKIVKPQTKKKLSDSSGDLIYTSNISFQIAAALRKQQSNGKNYCKAELLDNSAQKNGEFLGPSPEFVAEKIACSLDNSRKLVNFSVKACNGHLNLYSLSNQTASEYMPITSNVSGQSLVVSVPHGKKNHNPDLFTKASSIKRNIEVRMKRSCFDPEEYELYRKYQIKVHNDPPEHVTESSYKRFLVDSPIYFVPPTGGKAVAPCGFGSFHQQYIIDGKLIAVGVVDILPKCLSSKYLFWDPDLAFLSLGKYSALREIDWVKEAQSHCPTLQYYYLGYYIHSSSKMRYKAAYRPSELLCPLRYQWVPFDVVRSILDEKSYVVLSDVIMMNNRSLQPPLEDFNVHCHADEDMDDRIESFADEDVEMETDFVGSDADSDDDDGPKTSNLPLDDLKTADIGSIVMEVNGSRVKFRDLQRAFGPIEQGPLTILEQQLYRYAKVVGGEVANRMIYSRG